MLESGKSFRVKQKQSVEFLFNFRINSCRFNHVVVIQDYAKRAAETPFGVRVARAAQHERQVMREAKLKTEAEEKKAKEKANKLNEQAKKKAEQAKLKKAAAAHAKKEKGTALKRKQKAKKDLERMKREAKHGKKTVKTTI